MHTKTDSEGTSIDTTWPPRLTSSPPRRPLYYVQSPSNQELEKMSYGSSPAASPPHHYYHCSPIHHSRESSTSRFSASLKIPRTLSAWKHVQLNHHHNGVHGDDDDDDDNGDLCNDDYGNLRNFRVYICGFFIFVLLFTSFCLILWGASKAYKPQILVKSIVFENFNVQAGNDQTGVPTDMLSINSTVKIHYRNPATFFAVHVTSTPIELHYFQLKIATGQMKKFTQSRKSQRKLIAVVHASQIPLYGGIPILASEKAHIEKVGIPLNITFVVRSRAYILGRLVKSKFYNRIRCPVTFRGSKLGRPHNLTQLCDYY